MVKNILPSNIKCISVWWPEQLGLGHGVLRAKRIVGNQPLSLMLANEFILIVKV